MRPLPVFMFACSLFASCQSPQPTPTASAIATPDNQATPSPNLLFMRRVWSLGPALQYACFEVKQDHSYRLERDSASSLTAPIKAVVHSGKLTDTDFTAIEAALEDPALKSLQLPDAAPPQRKSDAAPAELDVLTMNIHRDSGLQRLFFDDGAAAQTSGNQFPSSYQSAALKPILALYQRISEGKSDLEAKATPACAKRVRE